MWLSTTGVRAPLNGATGTALTDTNYAGFSIVVLADNYADIGSKGIPEDVFHALNAEFSKKLPFKMAYWVSSCASLPISYSLYIYACARVPPRCTKV